MQGFFVFALMIYSSHSWILKTSHEHFIWGITKKITLDCRYNNQDHGKPRINQVVYMIIRKHYSGNQWETYAKIHNDREGAVLGDGVGPGISAKGYIGGHNNSFLSMTWSVASANTSGRYACEIDGITESDAIINVVTVPVHINESQMSLENKNLLSLSVDVKEQTENMNKEHKQMFGRVQELVQNTNERMYKERKAFNAIVESKISVLLWSGHWPGGQYALLNTEDGCPSSARNVWTGGYIRFHSESSSGSSNNSVSEPSHLAKPVFEQSGTNNYVYFRTCMMGTNSGDKPWPKGSYCLHLVGSSCPEGFEQGRVRLDAEDSNTVSTYGYNAPYYSGDVFYFCCRQDGASSTPIYLPADKPFYLYRYKGTCQKVYNTHVSEEWLQIDTEHSSNNDANLTIAYPDFKPHPAKFFLCYYSNLL